MKKFNASKRLRENNTIGDILQIIIKETPLQSGYNNVSIKQAWGDILGPGIKNYTLDILLRKDVLYVALSSPIVREELTYGKSKIIALLNEELKSEIVRDIVFR